MMQKAQNELYPPRPIYKGYAVFKILEKRPADESLFAERREGYLEKVRSNKAHEGLKSWVNNLKMQANITREDQ